MCTSLSAQRIFNIPITANFENQPIPDAISFIEDQYDIRIYYDPDQIPLYPINLKLDDQKLRPALQQILRGSNLVFTKYSDNSIVVTRRTELNKENADRIVQGWESGNFISPTSLEPREVEITVGEVDSGVQGTFDVVGKILDEASREAIIGATVAGLDIAAVSDVNGFINLKLPAGQHLMEVNYIGYQPIILELNVYADGQFDLNMAVRTFQLQDVVVSAESAKAKLESTNVGLELLNPKEIQALPSFMGEADIVRSLELLPGVSTVGEGASGFNVRGGSIDQNLVMQDGATIFNSSHALGIFSIFNADAVKRVTLYKGNIPAQFGGRLSSVLDVELRDGNFTKFSGKGGVGLASSRLLLEGPIIRNKLSFLASVRTSYSDWMLKRVRTPNVNQSSARFTDWSARLTYQLSVNTTLTASAFSSYDFFRFARDFGYSWQTDLYQANLRHFFTEKVSGKISAIHGRYKSSFFDPEGFDAFDYENGINYYNLKGEVLFQIGEKQQFNVGVNYMLYDSPEQTVGPRGDLSAIKAQSFEQDQGDEISAYISDEIKLSEKLSLSLGIRYTIFRQLGPGDEFDYFAEQPLNSETVVDTTNYASGDVIQTYSGLEPRASLNLQLGENNSIKFSYNRLRQYIHLISNTAAATPADIWQLSTPNIRPQTSDNYTIGYFHNFKDNEWVTSVEFYYKDLQDIVTYKDFPELLLNPNIETEVIQGEGRAYGVEFSVERTLGKWSGRASYAYSRSEIRTPSSFAEERLNEGQWFPADFDQPHRVVLALKWKMSPISSMQFNFTYRTGRPISVPTGTYGINEIVVSNFSPRNQFRLPAYHRFDWSINVDKSESKRKGYRSSFTVSLYNLYARKNPFSFFFRRNNLGVQQAYKLSVLGSTFPALSYNFIF